MEDISRRGGLTPNAPKHTKTRLPEKRIHIQIDKKVQYFEGVVPEVWEFQIGAYPPAQNWLKVRKGRILQPEDIRHYQSICKALRETLSVMTEIELEIARHGGWPLRKIASQGPSL